MKCKECNEDKTKKAVIKGTVTRFLDENGRMWNGMQCPDCYKTYNKERMRRSRKSYSSSHPSPDAQPSSDSSSSEE